VPILKSTLILNKDLSAQPVWSEAFFMTLTHEMGHTLGLQHTLTSSVMSTEITRAMSKASPLGDDDRAGVSALYPTPDFATRFGSISGRVTAGSAGMNLASVVALTLDGTAISALTNPDGTYRIEGLPPGNYATMFFLRAPYNPGSTNAMSNQTAQFCRQCHGDKSNEMNGSTAGTVFSTSPTSRAKLQ